MLQSKPSKLTLDKERTIVYDNRAEFRMGSLDRPFELSDLRTRRKAWAALVAWVWACLSEADAPDFPSPEKVAPFLETPEAVNAAFEALVQTHTAAQPDQPKNV